VDIHPYKIHTQLTSRHFSWRQQGLFSFLRFIIVYPLWTLLPTSSGQRAGEKDFSAFFFPEKSFLTAGLGNPFYVLQALQSSDIFIINANAFRPADPIMYYAFSLICIDFSTRGWFFIFVRGEKKGKNRGIQKPIFEIPFFSPSSSCDVCGVITHSAGYVWFSIQFRLSKTSGVFAFPPFTPFNDLWARLLFTYSFQFETTRENKHVDEFLIRARGEKRIFRFTGQVALIFDCFTNSLS
jgi:hypothetical protein